MDFVLSPLVLWGHQVLLVTNHYCSLLLTRALRSPLPVHYCSLIPGLPRMVRHRLVFMHPTSGTDFQNMWGLPRHLNISNQCVKHFFLKLLFVKNVYRHLPFFLLFFLHFSFSGLSFTDWPFDVSYMWFLPVLITMKALCLNGGCINSLALPCLALPWNHQVPNIVWQSEGQ